VQLDDVEAADVALVAAAANAWTVALISANSARGARRSLEGQRARRDGRPAASSSLAMRWSAQGESVEPLRPACASWMPIFVPWEWAKSTTGRHAATCASLQMPGSFTRYAPRQHPGGLGHDQPGTAGRQDAQVDEVQAPTRPSTAEYWHMGLTQVRFANSTSRS